MGYKTYAEEVITMGNEQGPIFLDRGKTHLHGIFRKIAQQKPEFF